MTPDFKYAHPADALRAKLFNELDCRFCSYARNTACTNRKYTTSADKPNIVPPGNTHCIFFSHRKRSE